MSFDTMIRSGRKKPLFAWRTTGQAVDMGRREIERMVPHRDPFLLIDRVTRVDLTDRTIVGERWLDPADPVFAGHFPGDPVYPGVLLVEIMAQLAICLQHVCSSGRAEVHDDDQPPRLRLLRVHHGVFLAEARPEDHLTVLGRLVEDNGYTAILAGQVLSIKHGGEQTICALAIMEAVLLEDG